jgi:multiple sugar transport system substrate-binding protein
MCKKTIKSLCAFLSLMFILALFAGCGSSSSTQTGNSNGSDKPVSIKFASWAQRGDTPDVDWISGFEKKYPNMKIDYVAVTEGNYSEKINAMVAAKTAPDVILAWECDIAKFVKNKNIVSLDDYVKNTKAFSVDDLEPAVAQFGQMTGGLYGIPWCLAAEILYYNKNMFDKAGVAYPTNDWTTQQFVDAAKKLTIVDNGKTTQWGCDAISFQGIWYAMMGAAGDNVVDKNGKLSLGDGAKKALQLQVDLTNKYKVCPPPAASGTNAVDLFSAGKAAMTRTGNWMIQTYRPIKDFKWDIAPLPKDVRQYTNLHTGILTINADSKIKDAAWKFIEYTLSDDGQERVCKMGTNPSSRKSITAKGFYRAGGENGPTNWAGLDESVAFGQFGYVVANAGVTNNAINNFNAVLMGQMDVDTAIKKSNDEADKVAAQ